MDIPVNADVHCKDGFYGRSTYVILNPVSKQATHLVVREDHEPHVERLVPVRLVKETTPDLVLLDCTRDEVKKLRPFVETEFIQAKFPQAEKVGSELMLLPYTVMVTRQVQIEQKHKAIPPGELAVRRGAPVRLAMGAWDGWTSSWSNRRTGTSPI